MSDSVVVRADDDTQSAKAKEIEDTLKADKARKDAESEDRFNKLCDAIEGLTTGMNGILDRMDALEAGGGGGFAGPKKKPGDIGGGGGFAGPKKDDDDFSNGKMPGEPMEPTVDSDDENDFAAAQSKADSVANLFGKSAPRPLDGERLLAYRRRLLRPYLEHSDAFRGVDLAVVSVDKGAFDGIEAKVYSDAEAAARNPKVPEYQLIERSVTKNGHTYTTFWGDPRSWLADHSGHIGTAVTGFGPTK